MPLWDRKAPMALLPDTLPSDINKDCVIIGTSFKDISAFANPPPLPSPSCLPTPT